MKKTLPIWLAADSDGRTHVFIHEEPSERRRPDGTMEYVGEDKGECIGQARDFGFDCFSVSPYECIKLQVTASNEEDFIPYPSKTILALKELCARDLRMLSQLQNAAAEYQEKVEELSEQLHNLRRTLYGIEGENPVQESPSHHDH